MGLTGNGLGAGEYGSVEEVKMAGALWVAKKIQEVLIPLRDLVALIRPKKKLAAS